MSEKIKGEGGVGDKPAPEMKREGGVDAGETGYKMRFEGVDGLFGGVCSVVVWRGKLVVDIVKFEEGLETRRAFVVGDLKEGFESAV